MRTRAQLSTAAVGKLFDRTRALICILDLNRKIRYLNEACANWLGIEAESAMGRSCHYTSEPCQDGQQEKLNTICPPPEIFDPSEPGHSERFWISSQGRSTWRSANAFRMIEPDQDPLILIVGSATDSIELPPSHDEASDLLHQAIIDLRKTSKLHFPFKYLVGTSSHAHRIRRQVRMASESLSDLLIVGEPGTGKQHLARTIDAGKSSLQTELIPIDCAVADQPMIQSVIGNLLGRSNSRRPSREMGVPADSLLLLNVDSLNHAGQAELLGFLQLPEFPLRLISTSNHMLDDLAGQGEYQKELAAYLSTSTIVLPPLRDRPEDIALLAQCFVEQANQTREQQSAGLAASTLRLLSEYYWPGNLDELRAVVDEACRNCKTSRVLPEDLPKRFHDSISAMRIGTGIETSIVLEDYLRAIEKKLVLRALQQAKGNKTKAASLLGISRAKLIRRTQQLDVHDASTVRPAPDDRIEPSAFKEID
jgi:DNA-binding NtrC family response regulator